MGIFNDRKSRRNRREFTLVNGEHVSDSLDRRLLTVPVISIPFTGNLFQAESDSGNNTGQLDNEFDTSAAEITSDENTFYIFNGTVPYWTSTRLAGIENIYTGPSTVNPPGTDTEVEFSVQHSATDQITSYDYPVGASDVSNYFPGQVTIATGNSTLVLADNQNPTLAGDTLTVIFSATLTSGTVGFERIPSLSLASTYLNVRINYGDTVGLAAVNNYTGQNVAMDTSFGNTGDGDSVYIRFTVPMPSVATQVVTTQYISELESDAGHSQIPNYDESIYGTNTTSTQLSDFDWNLTYDVS